jgi:hypothetical protein
MMIILASENIHMKCNTRCHSERVKHMRDHLRRKIANLLSREIEGGDTVWPSRDIYDSSRKSLI